MYELDMQMQPPHTDHNSGKNRSNCSYCLFPLLRAFLAVTRSFSNWMFIFFW